MAVLYLSQYGVVFMAGLVLFLHSYSMPVSTRFIIIISKYTGTAVLDCMTACDIATFVHVAHELLCCHIEHAEVPTA